MKVDQLCIHTKFYFKVITETETLERKLKFPDILLNDVLRIREMLAKGKL